MSISNHATLAGKRALVTGGTRGIGAAIVRRFAAEGEHVAFTYQASHDRAEALAAELTEDGTTVIALQADAGNLDDATHAVKRAAAELGGLDILVHNAGVSAFAPFGEAGHCMHEALFSDHGFAEGMSTLDVAKGLIDEGFHPMTMYFPLVVHGAMLVEPTETESKATLDEFVTAMRSLAERAKTGDETLKSAPHHAPRARLDEAQAARKPVLAWDGFGQGQDDA